jgi:hypothetical protein
MPDLSSLPPDLQRVIERAISQVDGLSEQIAAGDLTPDQWQREMERLIARYFQTAAMAGLGADDIALLDPAISRMVDIQNDYLANFKTDIDADGWLGAFAARAQMYASAVKQGYWLGDVVKKVGRMIPLPAMPTEGTQCLSHCLCFWRIETVNAEQGDYDAYWQKPASDSCQTCIERELQWNPVRIRNGELL